MTVTPADLDRMADALLLPGGWRGRASSRFWVLLTLAAVIASAGLIADSTATVIGAMIVAPLMTPILGTAFAIALADVRNVVRCATFVGGGAILVIAIGWTLGQITDPADAFASVGNIDARIHPRLIDLVAALATGTVGAFALVRSDVSDTLPGVAIAISLVPPLAVVGLLLSTGRNEDAFGALLLFATNVAAIVATGVLVLVCYRVRDVARANGRTVGALRARTVGALALIIAIIAMPLAWRSFLVARDTRLAADAQPLADDWATRGGWMVSSVTALDGVVTVVGIGPQPGPDAAELRRAFDTEGLETADLVVTSVYGLDEACPAFGACERVTRAGGDAAGAGSLSALLG